MTDTRYLPATRRAPATILLFLAVAACWAAWMGWDVHYDVDVVTGRATGPYQPWQVVGCVLSLVAVVTAAARRLPFVSVLVTTPAAFTLAWSVSAALSEDGDGLWPIGAVLVFVASVGATVLVGGLADIAWTECRRRRERVAQP